MENVLVAFIIIFVIVFAALTLTGSMISGQDVLQVNYREVEERLGEQTRTNLVPVDEPVYISDTSVNFAFRNVGATRLTDFDQWDVIVQYFDDSDPAAYYVDWLSYTNDAPVNNEWTVEGIYLDAREGTPEVFEPGILNTDEELVLTLDTSPQVGAGQVIQVAVTTPYGVGTSTMSVRNIPPELFANLGLTITHGDVGVIDSTLLLTTDDDNEPQDLLYSLLALPAEGSLSLVDGFTQVQLDSDLLLYTAEISGDYSFEFTVSDGKDVIGPYIFPITVINEAPVLAANTGLTLPSGTTAEITSVMLDVTDADDAASNLTYTVTSMPTQGTLNPGAVFTQEHIDDGLLSYTHTGTGDDSFEFSVSDGENVVGTYTFNITVS